jgi:hypothetical protein
MPYLAILMIVACAIFFHRAAEFENESSVVWTGLPVVISVTTLFVFHWGWLVACPARLDFSLASQFFGRCAASPEKVLQMTCHACSQEL